MKYKTNILLKISLPIILVTLIYLLFFVDYNNLLPKPPLPQKYKAYQELKLGKDSLFTISRFKADYYDSIRNQFIRVEDKNYYKIKADGIIIDSLKLDKNINIEYNSGYLLNVDFYYDWILTGNAEKHKYENIDNNGIITKQDLTTFIKKAIKQAKFTHTFYSHTLYPKDSSELQNKFLFLINNKWKKLSVSNRLDYEMGFDEYYKEHDDRIKYFRIVDENLALIDPYTPADFRKNKSIQQIPYRIVYYDIAGHTKAVSNTMNNDHGAFSDGVAYINFAYGMDTLKFKSDEVMLIDTSEWASWVKYERCPEIFANPKVNFIIMNYVWIDGKLNCVMIKRNKEKN